MNPDSAQRRGITAGHDGALIGLATLMRMAFSGADLAPLGMELLNQASTDSAPPNVLMDLSTVLQLRGEHDLALSMQMQALALQQIYSPPTLTEAAVLRLLAIMGPGDLMANTPLEFLLEDSDVALDLFYVAPGIPLPATLPEHDLLFVAIGESAANQSLLQRIEAAVASWPHPVLNPPQRIARLSRDNVCAMLQGLPGIIIPNTMRIGRQILEEIAAGQVDVFGVLRDGKFPVIARPVDSHAGQGLARLDDADAVADYLRSLPQAEFYISRFVDYRSADGLFRKYRVILIEGKPYACHMAISSDWMIHYLNAGMADSLQKRVEEARFMQEFDTGFAQRHAAALAAIHTATDLDYVGMDCAESADGRLLIFEVDSNMLIHAMDPADVFPYKQVQMRKVFAAFRALLGNARERGQRA